MQLSGLEGASNYGNPSHLPPPHTHTLHTRWRTRPYDPKLRLERYLPSSTDNSSKTAEREPYHAMTNVSNLVVIPTSSTSSTSARV